MPNPPKPDTNRARKLRKSANLPEQTAWQALRKLRVHGYPVRRQHPIGGYFADFAIVKARMIIEIDGGVHDLDGVNKKDAIRQAYLEREGWRIVRVSSETALIPDHIWARITTELGL